MRFSLTLFMLLLAAGCTGGNEPGSRQSVPGAPHDTASADTVSADSAAGARSDSTPAAGNAGMSRTVLRPDFQKFFAAQNAEGCFVLYNLNADSSIRYNPERCAEGFLPASTFKIFNSLVALETGVMADENVVVKWDGVDRGSKEWNQDQTMRTAFQRSAVWFYQEIARRVGEKRMKYYLERERYGNRNMGGELDKFWLSGDLRISPDQQVEFLTRLYKGELGFSERSMNIVKDIMTMESTPGYTLRGKTGWAIPGGDSNIVWIVGYLERDRNAHIFALNLLGRGRKYPVREARMAILKDILGELALIRE